MSRRLSEMDRLLSERHLFHGTSADVVEGICKHNFDPRVCGKHATMFGQGSYFARKAVYSHNFSKRSPKGVHCMFLAKVLTGRCVMENTFIVDEGRRFTRSNQPKQKGTVGPSRALGVRRS